MRRLSTTKNAMPIKVTRPANITAALVARIITSRPWIRASAARACSGHNVERESEIAQHLAAEDDRLVDLENRAVAAELAVAAESQRQRNRLLVAHAIGVGVTMMTPAELVHVAVRDVVLPLLHEVHGSATT